MILLVRKGFDTKITIHGSKKTNSSIIYIDPKISPDPVCVGMKNKEKQIGLKMYFCTKERNL